MNKLFKFVIRVGLIATYAMWMISAIRYNNDGLMLKAIFYAINGGAVAVSFMLYEILVFLDEKGTKK